MYETREDRQKEYDKYAAIIDNMVARSERHRQEDPGCGAAPICIEGEVMQRLHMLCIVDDQYPVLMIAVAINELSRARKREATLTQRLEIQRGIAADAIKRIGQLEDEAQELLVRLDAAEHIDRVIEP